MSNLRILPLFLGAVVLFAGCATEAPSPDEGVSSQTSAFSRDTGWDVVLTDGYGYGFCLSLNGGYLCTSQATENYNEVLGDYTTHYPGCETGAPGCGKMAYSRDGLPYYVTKDGVVMTNCLQFQSRSGPIRCQYIFGSDIRVIRANRSLLRYYGGAFAKVMDSVGCAVAVGGADAQGIAESCFI